MLAAQFPVTATTGDAVSNYLVGSTHRKDLLDGALWHRLRDQLHARTAEQPIPAETRAPSGRSGKGLPLGPGASLMGEGSARETLAAILGYSLGLMRWEPLNPNPEHRACPSPGSRFTVDALVSCQSDAGPITYRYLPREDALILEPAAAGAALEPGVVGIALRCDLARCASPYGDLAFCLTSIELGAVVAQLVLVLGTMGLGLDEVHASMHAGLAGGPGLVARVRAPGIAAWLGSADARSMRWLHDISPTGVVGGCLLHDLLASMPSGQASPPLFPDGLCAGRNDAETLLRATTTRSSGLDLLSEASGTPAQTQVIAMLDMVAVLHGSFRGLAQLPVRIEVAAAGEVTPVSADRWRLAAGSRLELSRQRDSGLARGYAHPAGALIATVSANVSDYTKRLGADALFGMYLAAGIATQVVCLAAASVGLVCRPMRSFDHAAADAGLAIDCWSVVQLVAYGEAVGNPAFAIGGVPWAARA